MRVSWPTVPALIAATVATVALAGCGASSSGGAASAGQYSTQVEKHFVASCATGGTAAASCECMLHKLEAQLSPAQFAQLDQIASSGSKGLTAEQLEYIRAVAAACKRGG